MVKPMMKPNLPFHPSLPLYYQLAQIFKARVTAEGGPADGRLPTEHELCKEFGVSRTTVRQALALLKTGGLLSSKRGVGTFLSAARRSELAIKVTGDSLHHGLGTKIRVVSLDLIDPVDRVADVLAGSASAKVLRVVRIHELSGVAVSVVISYLPGELDAIIAAKDLETTTMHELLWRKVHLKLEKSVHTIRIVRADEKIAPLLHVSLAEPVLHIQAEAYLDTGRPIWITDNYFREDSYEYRAEMLWGPPTSSGRLDMPGAWVGRGIVEAARRLRKQAPVHAWQPSS